MPAATGWLRVFTSLVCCCLNLGSPGSSAPAGGRPTLHAGCDRLAPRFHVFGLLLPQSWLAGSFGSRWSSPSSTGLRDGAGLKRIAISGSGLCHLPILLAIILAE